MNGTGTRSHHRQEIERSMAGPETRFRAKTWIFRARVIGLGFFTLFGMIYGPLFLTGAMKDAMGRPARGAGIGITAVTLGFFLPAFAIAFFNLGVRRPPLVRICREGIEARLIGGTSLDGVPSVPGLVRFYWGLLSTQSFSESRPAYLLVRCSRRGGCGLARDSRPGH